MKKAPKTRFSPFQEEWASERFADAFSVLPNNTLSRAELSDEAGTVKNVHYGDVLIKYGEYLDAGKTDIPFIASEELAERWKSAALQNGDVVMADTAEDTTAGKCTEVGNIRSDIIVSGLHTIPLHPQSRFSAGYLGYYMNSDAFHDQLISLMQGTKVTSISKSSLADSNLRFPTDPAEQESIAKALNSLDRIIDAQKCKCEKLIALKAACLDKMFPKAGSQVPELRFEGFTKEWEHHELGKLGTLKNGMNFSKDAMGHGFPFVNLQDVFGKNAVDRNNLGLAEATSSQLEDYDLIQGDVLFVRSSVKLEGVGEAAVIPQDFPNTTFSGFLIRFRDEYGLDLNFKKYLFSIDNVRRQILSQATNSANKNISQTVLACLTVLLPDVKEQKVIGDYLSNLDNLIALNQIKLDKLRQFKQALMHNMFV